MALIAEGGRNISPTDLVARTKPKPKSDTKQATNWEKAYTNADRGSPKAASTKDDQAIRDFQAANGLTVDGIIGPQTRAALAAAKAKTSSTGGDRPDKSLVQRQKDIDAIATASPAAAQAMQKDLNADVAATPARVQQIDQDIDALGTSSSSVTQALQQERNRIVQDFGEHQALTNPEPAPPTPMSGSDRRFYIEAADRANDPSILETFDEDLDAYNESQTLPEITLGSDRRFYAQAAQLKDDPSILQDFDQRLDEYNNFKNAVAQTYDSQVDALINQHGYDPAVAEDLVSLDFQNSGLPTHALPDQARNLNFENRNEGSDRRLYAMSDDPKVLQDFDAGSPEYRQFREVIGQRFDRAVDEMMEDQGYSRPVAENLVAMQFAGSGVPTHTLPDGVQAFDPGKVLQQKNEVFDTANQTINDDDSFSFSKVINQARGRDGADGFTATSDINTIVANPNEFDPDVVATAIVLQNAINKPGNEDFKAQFESKSLWQQVKDSDWLDPNTDDLGVNLVRAVGTGGLSLAFADDFNARVAAEGPGALKSAGKSLYELSSINQIRLAFTDRDQLLDNYKSFGGGVWDWGVDTAKLGVGLAALGTPGGADALKAATGTDVRQVALDTVLTAGDAALNDPEQLLKSTVGWDQFIDDPYRWAGNQAPDIVLEILGTKGAGKAAKAFRGADAATDATQAGRLAQARQGAEAVIDHGKAFVDDAKQIAWALDRDVQTVVADIRAGVKAGGQGVKAGLDWAADVLSGNPTRQLREASNGSGSPSFSHAASVGETPSSGTPSPSGLPSTPRQYPILRDGAEIRDFKAATELTDTVDEALDFLNSPAGRAQGLHDFATIFEEARHLGGITEETLQRFDGLLGDARLPDSRYARIENQLQATRNAVAKYIKADVVTRESLDLLRNEGLDAVADFAEGELRYLNGLKAEAVTRFDQLINDPRFADIKGQLGKTKNAIAKHLGSDDLIGAIRDNHGLPVPNPTRPKTDYNHLQEVENGLRSVENTRDALKDAINPKKFDGDDRLVSKDTPEFQRSRETGIPNELSSLLDLIDEILARGTTIRDFRFES